MSRILGVIPARLGSTRLTRKPLQLLAGAPLVTWVWGQTRQMPFLDRVVVATDAPEVASACEDWGVEVLLTAPGHESGTDRVWEVVERVGEGFSFIVNIQGDEPLVAADHVRRAVALLEDGYDVGTCAAPISLERDFADPAVVKVVRRTDGSALYFSRAAIPHRRADHSGDGPRGHCERLRHIGIYAYKREALGKWVDLQPSPLEREEGLEQLRALQAGLEIGVAIVDYTDGGIDTPEDLVRMENHVRKLGIQAPVKTA